MHSSIHILQLVIRREFRKCTHCSEIQPVSRTVSAFSQLPPLLTPSSPGPLLARVPLCVTKDSCFFTPMFKVTWLFTPLDVAKVKYWSLCRDMMQMHYKRIGMILYTPFCEWKIAWHFYIVKYTEEVFVKCWILIPTWLLCSARLLVKAFVLSCT